MMDWLNSAISNYPNLFGYPANKLLFDSERAFEALLRIFPQIIDHVQLNPAFSSHYNKADFDWSFQQHVTAFTNASSWERLRESGEDSLKQLYQIRKVISLLQVIQIQFLLTL